MNDQLPKSIMLILDERARQVVEEGYDAPHDMEHEPDQLATAGAVYALPNSLRYPQVEVGLDGYRAVSGYDEPSDGDPLGWPWEGGFKPTPDDRLRELVKAGALIVAEIDRMIMEERMRRLQSIAVPAQEGDDA